MLRGQRVSTPGRTRFPYTTLLRSNELWEFELGSNTWEEIHGFMVHDNLLEGASPATALRARGYTTLKPKKSDFASKQSGYTTIKPLNCTIVPKKSATIKKSSSMKTLPSYNKKRQKQFELSAFIETDEPQRKIKPPNSPVSTIMKNSIVLRSYAKKPIKDLYDGPTEKDEGEISAKVPCARDGHGAAIYNGRMIIFGGDRNKISFSDLYFYMLD